MAVNSMCIFNMNTYISTHIIGLQSMIDWLVFYGTSTQDRSIVPIYQGLRRWRIANEEHTKHTVACVTMNIHIQQQRTGMPYLLKDKQCIQQITRPRVQKRKPACNTFSINWASSHLHPKTTFERERFSINLYNIFYNSTFPLPSMGFAHPLISSRGQSHEYSIFSRAKPLTRNHISCSKNALKLTYSNEEFQILFKSWIRQ